MAISDLQGSYDYSPELRNLYLRHVLNTLTDKYFVQRTQIAKNINVAPSTLTDFASGRRKLSVKRLDDLEDFLNDLYGMIISDEVPQGDVTFTAYLQRMMAHA